MPTTVALQADGLRPPLKLALETARRTFKDFAANSLITLEQRGWHGLLIRPGLHGSYASSPMVCSTARVGAVFDAPGVLREVKRSAKTHVPIWRRQALRLAQRVAHRIQGQMQTVAGASDR